MFKYYEVTVQGVTPLLTNRFRDSGEESANRPVFRGEEGTPREQAFDTLYFANDNETPIIPGGNLFSSFMEAGKYMKSGRNKITTTKSSMIPAFLHLEEHYMPITHKDEWDVFSTPVRIPATGGRIMRHRAMFHDWELSFSLTLDTEVITPKMLRQIVDIAGKRIGLGDFRPQTKGQYGRFVVTDWKELKKAS